MTGRALAGALVVAMTASAAAQDMRFFYRATEPGTIAVSTDVAYGDRRMDIFRPAGRNDPLPALVFFNTATGAQRTTPFYKTWAELAASSHLVGILPDLRRENAEQDFDALIAFLVSDGARLGVDPERIAVYAGSGNVFTALPIVENPRRTRVKAAVMYYGSAPVTEFRRDLPLLLVRAGLDRPPVNRAVADVVARAVTQNAPVTLLNYAGGHHAFEIVDDEEATRSTIDRTIAFVKEATAPAYQASLRRALPESTAASHVASGRFAEAASAYAGLVTERPDDARMRLAYGEALLGASRFVEACAELETRKGKGLGPRDLGVPAARACAQSGNADAAIAWLKSIPQRFLPRELESDPVFAAIRSRPDFAALFQPAR